MANETTIDLELWLRVLHGVLGSTLLLCNTICSCTVILVISFNKKLHYPSAVVYLGLVIADLILSAIWLAQVIAYLIAGRWQLGQGGCIHFGMILVWMLYVRWCEIATVTLDRFLAAVLPFAEYKMFHKRFLVAATILAWVAPALLVLPSVFGFGNLSFRPQLSACTVYCEQNYSCVGYYTMLFLIFQIIGVVLPFILYVTLYCIGRRKKRKQNNSTLLGTAQASINTHNNVTQLKTVTRTIINHDHQVMTTVTAKIPAHVEYAKSAENCSIDAESSNSSPHLPNQLERNSSTTTTSFRTSLSIFVTMILTHIPIYCTSVLEHFGNLYVSIPLVVHLSAVYTFLLGVLINSVIIMRSKDFRQIKFLARKYHNTGSREDDSARSEVNSSSTVSVEATRVHRNVGEEANSQE